MCIRDSPIGITVDERVTSGAHFSGFFGSMVRYLSDPSLLEVPPEKVLYDEKCEYHVPKVGETAAGKQADAPAAGA